MNTLTRLLQFALAQTWAMEEAFHARMFQVLSRASDGDLEQKLLTAMRADQQARDLRAAGDAPVKKDRRRAQMSIDRGVAVVPIHGVIAPHASQVDPLCSDIGASVEHIRGDLHAAIDNPDVKSILLAIDSPGGSVQGLDQLAADIRAARAKKPIIAHTDGLMASAAYWIGSQADKVFATRDAMVGSIGVIASFLDNHRALQDRGLDPVVIKSVPGKGITQGNGAFGDTNRAEAQAEVDAYHAMFVEAVAAGRGIDAAAANKLGDGRVHIGRNALEQGMVDGVQQMDASVRIARSMGRNASVAAAVRAVPTGQTIYVLDDEDAPITSEPEGNVAQGAPTTETEMDPKSNAPAAPAPAAPSHAITTPTVTEAQQERNRVTMIARAGSAAQRELVNRLIADGTPLVDALTAINSDLHAKLAAQTPQPSAATHPLGNGNTADVATKPDPNAGIKDMPNGEAKWKAEYEADPKLAAEFGEFAIYAGYRRNETNRAIARGKGEDNNK